MATRATIPKDAWPTGVIPNVVDYAAARVGFSWDAARGVLDGLPGGGGSNIAHEAVERHAAGAHRDRVAVRWLRRDERADEATYGELAVATKLALRPGWPSMFRGFLHDKPRYRACFAGGWYLTGDIARRDADGWVWFVGRADDVIKSAGHLIGPLEVESVLMEHPAVVEAGVIGIPDPVAGEVVKAFVTLAAGHTPSDDLRLDLIAFARRRLGAAVAPRALGFDQHLPETRSGKILRRPLRRDRHRRPRARLPARRHHRLVRRLRRRRRPGGGPPCPLTCPPSR